MGEIHINGSVCSVNKVNPRTSILFFSSLKMPPQAGSEQLTLANTSCEDSVKGSCVPLELYLPNLPPSSCCPPKQPPGGKKKKKVNKKCFCIFSFKMVMAKNRNYFNKTTDKHSTLTLLIGKKVRFMACFLITLTEF